MPQTTEFNVNPTAPAVQISASAADQSQPFIGQWNHLISTTNWEKGEIICQWRESWAHHHTVVADMSDEAWSQLVGGVTPQHVGRLRRTFERFGHTYREYDGIFWSHFYASLDWDDAEMWLEGAVQSKWSVSKMRKQRWETMGQLPVDEPQDRDIVTSEFQEEIQSLELSEGKRQSDRDYLEGPVYEGPDFGDESSPSESNRKTSADRGQSDQESSAPPSSAGIRPFESFTDLPEDVEEATNAFKVAIIRHKTDSWSEISSEDLIGVLAALQQLALIPAE